MKIFIEPKRNSWDELVIRPSGNDELQDTQVQSILDQVKKNGDQALKLFTEKFDGVSLKTFIVSDHEKEEAGRNMDEPLKQAIQIAKQNIQSFHKAQVSKKVFVETMPGVECWQETRPIEKIGIYIPGGSAPLFSTVLMLAIPAKIAGCKEIVLCSPPNAFGKINDTILYAAELCGVTKLYKVGGAQAIAAMAYGTKEIPQVVKIFGPGNSFVTLAKMKVQEQGVAIDMPAGPSEVLILADENADAEFIAIDLLSQAEHGADSQVVLVANTKEIIDRVLVEIGNQLKELPRRELASRALENSLGIVLAKVGDQIDFINAYAPEHLIINHQDADRITKSIVNAGSVFIGAYSPESIGDYASGTNHTLPTSAFAKAYSGVNMDSFTKKITYQRLTKEGLQLIGPYVEIMAEAEQLMAHKLAVTKRLQKLKGK